MKQQSQFRFIATLLVLALITFTPYFSGLLIKHYYQTWAQNLAHQNQFSLEIKEFDRSFFTSNVSLEIHIGPKDKASYVIPIEQHIIHGPFVIDFQYKKMPFSIALAHIHNKLGTEIKAQLKEFFNNEEPLLIMTKLGFSGKGTTYFTGSSTKQTTKTNFTIVWDGITGKIRHSLDLKQLSGEIVAPKLTIADANYAFEMLQTKTKFQSETIENIAIGSSTVSIDKLNYSEKTISLLDINELTVDSKLEYDSKNAKQLIYNLLANITKINICNKDFAQQQYIITANAITPEFLHTLHLSYDKKLPQINDLLQQLLTNEASLNILIPKDLSQAFVTFFNMQIYKNSLIGKVDPRERTQVLAEISKNVANSFEKLITNKIFALSKDSNKYEIKFNFKKDGKILLNDEPLQNPLAAFQGLNGSDSKDPTATPNAQSDAPTTDNAATIPNGATPAATPEAAAETATPAAPAVNTLPAAKTQ